MESRSPFTILDLNGDSSWRRLFADIGYDLKPLRTGTWDPRHLQGTGFRSSPYPVSDLKGREVEDRLDEFNRNQ